jgi:MarR family transcriptional regulator, organic hydroperoxide resistance regulator
MNNLSHEASLTNPAVVGSDAALITTELRTLWQGLVRASERAAHLDRQAYWVLSALESGPRRMSSLAESAQTSQASLTGIVDRLEDHGFVARLRSCEDRRVIDVSITEAGTAELCRGRKGFLDVAEAALGHITAEERTAFLGLLRKLNAAAPVEPKAV